MSLFLQGLKWCYLTILCFFLSSNFFQRMWDYGCSSGLAVVKYGCGIMREEMSKNEDLIRVLQEHKVKTSSGTPVNTQRRCVSEGTIILWHLCALIALFSWLLRLLNVFDITAV